MPPLLGDSSGPLQSLAQNPCTIEPAMGLGHERRRKRSNHNHSRRSLQESGGRGSRQPASHSTHPQNDVDQAGQEDVRPVQVRAGSAGQNRLRHDPLRLLGVDPPGAVRRRGGRRHRPVRVPRLRQPVVEERHAVGLHPDQQHHVIINCITNPIYSCTFGSKSCGTLASKLHALLPISDRAWNANVTMSLTTEDLTLIYFKERRGANFSKSDLHPLPRSNPLVHSLHFAGKIRFNAL